MHFGSNFKAGVRALRHVVSRAFGDNKPEISGKRTRSFTSGECVWPSDRKQEGAAVIKQLHAANIEGRGRVRGFSFSARDFWPRRVVGSCVGTNGIVASKIFASKRYIVFVG